MDDHGLEQHICSFAARISAATCVFLLAIAEYDRRRGWEKWECRSMVEWLAWHCRTSRVTAAQYCRTASALIELPVIQERFAAGALSYSQVRALVKVATPANEASLVELSEYMTANQLERVTATYQRCRAAEEETAAERQRRRTLTWGHDEDGSVTGVFRLPPEQAAVVIKAIEERTAPIDPAAFDRGDEGHVPDPLGARRADALVEIAGADLDRQSADAADAGDRYLVTVIVDEAALHTDGAQPQAESPDIDTDTDIDCHLLDGPALAPSTIEQMLCDQPMVKVTVNSHGDVLDVGRRTRRTNRPIRRALAIRDGGCRFPGCGAKTVQTHHIRHWTKGGHTRLDNLVSLCSRHHHRHHQGGFQIEPQADGSLAFVLANGRRLRSVPPNPATPPGGGFPEPLPELLEPKWDGTPLTPWVLGAIVDHLYCVDPPRPRDEHDPFDDDDEAGQPDAA